MTLQEYDESRRLPERKRATLNGKRCIKSFIKSIRDRLIVEQPDWVRLYDTNVQARLLIAYFFFTKYVVGTINKNNNIISAMILSDELKGFYIDNILDCTTGYGIRSKIRKIMHEKMEAMQ